MSCEQKIVGIISYGYGNIRSVINSLDFIGYKCVLIENKDDLKKVKNVILPGVGSFSYAMAQLEERSFPAALSEWISNPANKLVGICLGMQLLCRSSEESPSGLCGGLGLIDAEVRELASTSYHTLPNMGWSKSNFQDGYFSSCSGDYYFVHSYGVFCDQSKDQLAWSMYGDTKFASAIQLNNVIGFQFHPEKSHKLGLNLLKMTLSQ